MKPMQDLDKLNSDDNEFFNRTIRRALSQYFGGAGIFSFYILPALNDVNTIVFTAKIEDLIDGLNKKEPSYTVKELEKIMTHYDLNIGKPNNLYVVEHFLEKVKDTKKVKEILNDK